MIYNSDVKSSNQSIQSGTFRCLFVILNSTQYSTLFRLRQK